MKREQFVNSGAEQWPGTTQSRLEHSNCSEQTCFHLGSHSPKTDVCSLVVGLDFLISCLFIPLFPVCITTPSVYLSQMETEC